MNFWDWNSTYLVIIEEKEVIKINIQTEDLRGLNVFTFFKEINLNLDNQKSRRGK